jgi:hypothetical protein
MVVHDLLAQVSGILYIWRCCLKCLVVQVDHDLYFFLSTD